MITEGTGVGLAEVVSAYGRMAGAYIDLFDGAEKAADEDRDLIARWAGTLRGPVLDAGCGPGHWSAFLHGLGLQVEGVDATPELVAHAEQSHPGVRFGVADLRHLDLPPASLGGVLAWYSLIHTDPAEVPAILSALADALVPDGSLMLGYFAGPERRMFDHGVVRAWTWPAAVLASTLEAAGLSVLEQHERPALNGRIHASVVARRR